MALVALVCQGASSRRGCSEVGVRVAKQARSSRPAEGVEAGASPVAVAAEGLVLSGRHAATVECDGRGRELERREGGFESRSR